MEITGYELEQKIKNGEKIILKLEASWCQPCQAMKPIFEKVANENKGRVQMYTMDVDQNRDTAMKLGIRSVPTIKLINGGDVIGTKVGALQEQEIKGLVQELING
jgi:thioredoxin 1